MLSKMMILLKVSCFINSKTLRLRFGNGLTGSSACTHGVVPGAEQWLPTCWVSCPRVVKCIASGALMPGLFYTLATALRKSLSVPPTIPLLL